MLDKQEAPICDYSLHAIRSFGALLGDRIVTTAFVGTYTRGFTLEKFATEKLAECAVCLQPGTEVEFDRFPRKYLNWFGPRIKSKLARFRKVDIYDSMAHHDALEFANGEIVKLNDLARGLVARVIQVPAGPAVEDKHGKSKDSSDLPTERVWTVPRIIDTHAGCGGGSGAAPVTDQPHV